MRNFLSSVSSAACVDRTSWRRHDVAITAKSRSVAGGREGSERARTTPRRWSLTLGDIKNWQAPAVMERRQCPLSRSADCVADDVSDLCWSGDAGNVIDRVCLYCRLHSLRHVTLRLRHDHPGLSSNNQPA